MSKPDERRSIGQVPANSGPKVTKWWNGASRLQEKNAAPQTCFDATRYHKKFSTRQRKTKHVMYATPCQKCSIGHSRICENLVELNNPPASCIPDCFGVATISLAPVGVASTTYPFVMIHAQCPVKICRHIIPAKLPSAPFIILLKHVGIKMELFFHFVILVQICWFHCSGSSVSALLRKCHATVTNQKSKCSDTKNEYRAETLKTAGSKVGQKYKNTNQ